MYPDVIPPVVLRQALPGGSEIEGRSLLQFVAELLRPKLLNQVAHPGGPAVLPVTEFAEDLGDAPRKLDGLIGAYEHVYVRGHPRPVGEAAADAHVETDGPVFVPGGEQTDVVDLRLGAVLQAARDAHLELPRQIRVLAVAGEVVVDRLGHGVGVYDLLVVEARDRATQDVAGRVAARLNGRHPYLL